MNETLAAEEREADDLTRAILRHYGYTDEQIDSVDLVHPGLACDNDECYDEDGESIHGAVYDEAWATSSVVVEVVLPWLAARDEARRIATQRFWDDVRAAGDAPK